MHRLLTSVYDLIFATADKRVAMYLRLIYWCRVNSYKIFGIILVRKLQRKYGVFVGHRSVFDRTLILRHPTGVVIGMGAVIGKNVTIFQNVTIGKKNPIENDYPTVGNDTIIYAGAVVIGNIKIGSNCIIGANTVVNKNIPDNSIVVGSPARIISKKVNVLHEI